VKKMICTVCGFTYDESAGSPDTGVAPGTLWGDIPESWVCPLCGASKSDFWVLPEVMSEEKPESNQTPRVKRDEKKALVPLTDMAKSALCSNLAKGCGKQYLAEAEALFNRLSDYFKTKGLMSDREGNGADFGRLAAMMENDLNGYQKGMAIASVEKDRGALRALTWGEKASKIASGMVKRLQAQSALLSDQNRLYVCDICGFMIVGELPPAICPVCKVPDLKIHGV